MSVSPTYRLTPRGHAEGVNKGRPGRREAGGGPGVEGRVPSARMWKGCTAGRAAHIAKCRSGRRVQPSCAHRGSSLAEALRDKYSRRSQDILVGPPLPLCD